MEYLDAYGQTLFYYEENGEYTIYVTDEVFEEKVNTVASEELAKKIAELLVKTHNAGLADGGPPVLKRKLS